jgi:hypothetical protein
MFKFIPILLLLFLPLIIGCTSIRPPAPTPIPEVNVTIKLPSYSNLTVDSSDCVKYRCQGNLTQPVLVVAEELINKTTLQNRLAPFNIPECNIMEVNYDKTAFKFEKRIVSLPDYSNFFNLYYFIPLKKGEFTIKIKNSCQLRGNSYTFIAR